MDKMENYREKFETQFKEWKAKIEMLEGKAAKATGETKTEMMKAIGELSQKKEVVKEKWNKLEKESGVAWETMKEGVEKSAAELKTALDKIVSRFK
jgi:phosphoenolpyruvate-protein kinase (PTS system EI component)